MLTGKSIVVFSPGSSRNSSEDGSRF